MPENYKPISCNYHDMLESVAIRREVVTLTYAGSDGQNRQINTRIVDVFARKGEEFVKTESGELIRLDRIKMLNETWFSPGPDCFIPNTNHRTAGED